MLLVSFPSSQTRSSASQTLYRRQPCHLCTHTVRECAEVNRILRNKFDPLNLFKLHPDSEGFEDTGSSDPIFLVNGEMRSRRKGDL